MLSDVAHHLQVLTDFYREVGASPPNAQLLAESAVPSPYRRLLVHQNDMTSTLEAFFGDRVRLRVLGSSSDETGLRRKVVLETEERGIATEFGAIRIWLDPIPRAARELIVKSELPLGGILNDCGVSYRCEPEAFFCISTDPIIEEALGLRQSQQLYGRRSVLRGADDSRLAEAIEILPPVLSRQEDGADDPAGAA